MKYTFSEIHRRLKDVPRRGWSDHQIKDLIDTLWRDPYINRSSGFDVSGSPDSDISFDIPTLTFSISPKTVRFSFWQFISRISYFSRKESLNVAIPNEEGLYMIYIFRDEEDKTLKTQKLFYIKNPTEQQIFDTYQNRVIVSFLYWNSDNSELIHLGDDRHGSEWNPQIHWYLHTTLRAQIKSGLVISQMEINQDGSANSHAQFTVTSGQFWHDDFVFDIDSVPSSLPVLNFYSAGHYPRYADGGAYSIWAPGSRACYNMGSSAITPADEGFHVMYHIFAVNDLIPDQQVISVMGQNHYETLAEAYVAVKEELNTIHRLMPQQGRCYLGSIVVQTSDTYTNSVKSRIVAHIGSEAVHPPVSIAPGSEDYLAVNDKQELTFILDNIPIPADGTDGREVELSTDSGYFVWRYVGDSQWNNLYPLPSDGEDGTDGREVEFQENAGWVEWRYTGDATWTQLFQIPEESSGSSLFPDTITSETQNAETATTHTHELGNINIDKIISGNPVELGALYNEFVSSDARGIAASGWSVLSIADWDALRLYLDPDSYAWDNIAGGKLKEVGTVYWKTPNTGATNEVGFNARGASVRYDTGDFIGEPNTVGWCWSTTDYDIDRTYMARMDNNTSGLTTNQFPYKQHGLSIRLRKDTTTLSNGETGIYTGNDGKVYPTICIDGVEYLTCNLNETKYSNGDWITGFDNGIYTPISNSAWAALTTEAMCYFDDDELYGGGETPLENLLEANNSPGSSGPMAGDGMDFADGEPVDLGTPSEVNANSTNSVTPTSHTHALGNIGLNNIANGTPMLYGALYNLWIARNPNISSSSAWLVPTRTDFLDLIEYLGGSSDAGGKLKETGTEHWASPNTGATDEYGFHARAGGERYAGDGTFINLLYSQKLWASTTYYTDGNYYLILNNLSGFCSVNGSAQPSHAAYEIRLCREATGVSDGTTTTYYGNNGKTYNAVAINEKYWLTESLDETKYRDGSWIAGFDGGVYTPVSNAAWNVLETAAMCYYDDDADNGGGFTELETVITQITDRVITLEAGYEEATAYPMQITGLTLTSAGWSLVSGLYQYDLEDSNITANSIVEIIPDNSDILSVMEAVILPEVESSSGIVKIFSMNAPLNNITVTINIFEKTN